MPADAILHAATDYGRQSGQVEKVMQANVALPLNLIDLAGESLKSFIAIDSYYNKQANVYRHLMDYCISKRVLIDWLSMREPSFSTSRIFVEHMYGPFDRPDKFVPSLLAKLRANEDIQLTNGTQRRDFIYVSDVATGIINVLDRSLAADLGSISNYEIGSGSETSLRDFVLQSASVTGSKSKLNFGAVPDRIGEIVESKADLTAMNRLNWQPTTSLSQGLELTLQNFSS